MRSVLEERLGSLPHGPGVYIFKDSAGKIIYVGKAADLHSRVRSYFGPPAGLSPKTVRLVSHVADVDFFVTASEQEALILECNLIKRHRPRYNIQLKDDKSFPYLKVSLSQQWPGVYVTRSLVENGSRYFGPFASAKAVRKAYKAIRGMFPFRSCNKEITGRNERACLNYYLGRCLGPCVGAVTPDDYAEAVGEVVMFLEGRGDAVLTRLEERMERASRGLDFEKAAAIRDQIAAVNQVIEGQKLATKVKGDQDAIAFAAAGDQAYVMVFFIRGGKLIGRESFVLKGTRAESTAEVMSGFLKQFYSSNPHIPPIILLQHPPADSAVIGRWLGGKRDGGVKLISPKRGGARELMDVVALNACLGLEQLRIKHMSSPGALKKALEELAVALGLPCPPDRIEGYDISNIQGGAAVGSMVVFQEGRPAPSRYRRFKIKTVTGADDCAMLREVLTRRFKRAAKAADGFAEMPALVLIDGGRGQLNAALEALKGEGMEGVPLMALAKEREEIFLPGRPQPLQLSRASVGLMLLQRVRDEAHRFAVGYHRRVRRGDTFASILDGATGIGPKRKRALMRRFGSVGALRDASVKDIMGVDGMGRTSAQRLKEYLG